MRGRAGAWTQAQQPGPGFYLRTACIKSHSAGFTGSVGSVPLVEAGSSYPSLWLWLVSMPSFGVVAKPTRKLWPEILMNAFLHW